MKSEKRLSQTLIHPENEIHLKTRNIEEGRFRLLFFSRVCKQGMQRILSEADLPAGWLQQKRSLGREVGSFCVQATFAASALRSSRRHFTRSRDRIRHFAGWSLC